MSYLVTSLEAYYFGYTSFFSHHRRNLKMSVIQCELLIKIPNGRHEPYTQSIYSIQKSLRTSQLFLKNKNDNTWSLIYAT